MPENVTYKVIMHDSVSLDGAFVGFDYSMELMSLHYQIADSFGETLRLFGSNTAKAAMEMFGGLTSETPEDFEKPQKSEGLTCWVITDSKALLINKLHYFRRSEYCRDVVVLVSESTPKEYLVYLGERNYDYYTVGKNQVDLKKALDLITENYDINTVLVDSGRTLTNALLNQGLVDEISLLVLPKIIGKTAQTLFSSVDKVQNLSLIKTESFSGGYTHCLYSVL